MPKYFYAVIFLSFITCESKESTRLSGVFCDQMNQCIYCDSTGWILSDSKIYPVESVTSQKLEGKGESHSFAYQYENHGTFVKVKRIGNPGWLEYKRRSNKNEIQLENLEFSSMSVFSDIELSISKAYEIEMRINRHSKFDPGNYRSQIPVTLFNFITALINSMELPVGSNLRRDISSDRQEWALKIDSGKEYNFYNNYTELTQDHENLVIWLERIPYFLELKQCDALNHLDSIRDFRESEFLRNLQLNSNLGQDEESIRLTKEPIPQFINCKNIKFNSIEDRADSLTFFMNESLNSSRPNKWDAKFFCAFPHNYEEMNQLFGYENNVVGPLYESDGNHFDKNGIFSDEIAFFTGLKNFMPQDQFYHRYIAINVNGKWKADHIREAFMIHQELIANPLEISKELATFSDKEIKSVFTFIFDGPHPKHSQNEDRYKAIYEKLQSQRLKLLLESAYEKLMGRYSKH